MWGYRNYDTDENSKNNVLIGLISNGEGWHNNHHAQPRAAAHGHKWWEFDVTYLTIQALKSVGLASKVVSFRELPPGRLVTNHQPVE
jgi:stearoyl-CoA desaturase (delta-9 desaturase)